jgi:uncharacterized protein DUF6916
VTDRHDVSVFAALRGGTFVVRLPGGAAQDLELVDVRDLGRRQTPHGEMSNYGLTFLGRMRAPLAQATYRLEHPTLGVLDVFLVPSGQDGDGVRYEAIFN